MVGASSSIFGCSSSWRKYGGAIEGENQKKKKKKKKKTWPNIYGELRIIFEK